MYRMEEEPVLQKELLLSADTGHHPVQKRGGRVMAVPAGGTGGRCRLMLLQMEGRNTCDGDSELIEKRNEIDEEGF
jgi:hypothetical protein